MKRLTKRGHCLCSWCLLYRYLPCCKARRPGCEADLHSHALECAQP